MSDEDKAALKALVKAARDEIWGRAFYTSEHILHYKDREKLEQRVEDLELLYERVFGEGLE